METCNSPGSGGAAATPKPPLSCREEERSKYAAVKLYYKISMTELPAVARPPDWLREEKMLNAAKTIANNTARRNLPAGACLPPDWLREEKMLNAAKTSVNNTARRNMGAAACRPPSSLRKRGLGVMVTTLN